MTENLKMKVYTIIFIILEDTYCLCNNANISVIFKALPVKISNWEMFNNVAVVTIF